MLVTERPGRLRIVEKGQLLPAVSGTPTVWVRQDGGLFDVEVHPDYARNGWIYLAYSEAGPKESSMTAVVRGKIKDNAWVEQQTIYKAPPELFYPENSHYGLRFVFDRPRAPVLLDWRPRAPGRGAGSVEADWARSTASTTTGRRRATIRSSASPARSRRSGATAIATRRGSRSIR